MNLRKGDMVMVISGREKGKTGKILLIDRQKQTVLVEHLNLVKRHQKATGKNKQSGIVEKEAPVAFSNVMYYDVKTAKPVKLGVQCGADGKKIRIQKKTGEAVDVAAS